MEFIVISTLGGYTYIIDMISPTYWTALLPILSDPMIEKFVFDGRDMADYLRHVHKKELRGTWEVYRQQPHDGYRR